MSDTDSFIEEVSEEVRRDRLFQLMKRYGWIAVVVIVVLVGGAAFNEWRKAQNRSQAEALGDSIMTALLKETTEERRSALDGVTAAGGASAVVELLKSTVDLEAGASDQAIADLQSVATDPEMPKIYSQLAELKLVMMSSETLTPQERIARLEPLTVPGDPYRLLAEEQIAIAEIADGQTDAAIQRLQALLADGEVTTGLRRRVSQLIVAMGGELDAA